MEVLKIRKVAFKSGNILISCGGADIFDSGSGNGMATVKYDAAMTMTAAVGYATSSPNSVDFVQPHLPTFPPFGWRISLWPSPAAGHVSDDPCSNLHFQEKSLSWQIVQHCEKMRWSRNPFDFPAVQNCM